MAIRVSEALQLPVMKHTKLVAGHRGMNNIIKWVTIVEVIEDIDRLQKGEFLITTAFGIDENIQQRNAFLKLLTANKLSGIAIYTSFYMKEIPESFISAANQSNLPLIEIPTDINFSVITKALLEQIVNNQMHLLEFSNTIHRKLTELVLNNKGSEEITNTLAQLTFATTFVYNEFYEVIHYKEQEINVDPLGKTTIRIINEKVDIKDILIESLKRESTIHHTVDPYIISVCPIIAKRSCYGWVAIVKLKSKSKELDEIAIGHAATIYAIDFLKKEAIEETKMRLQSDFLEDVFSHTYTNEEVAFSEAQKLGYDLSRKQVVFLFTFKVENENNYQLVDKLYHVIEQLLNQKKKQFLIQVKMNSLILLTDVAEKYKENYKKFCLQLSQEISEQWLYFFPESPLLIGIGKVSKDINQLSKSAKQAKYAIEFSDLIHSNSLINYYEDLGMYDLLLEMKESGIDLRTIYMENLENIIPTNEKSVDLINTLDVYLKSNQSIQTAADKLYIHRHTLRYRLNQIEKRTGLNLKSADDRLKLQMAVMAYKLDRIQQQI
mgnify:CR=1 FL=1